MSHEQSVDESGPLDPEQARDLFSEAFEAELDDVTQARFDATLAAHATLAEEYEAFVALFAGTRALDALEAPDLLPHVQRKLRERSRGRFYRDRFSQLGPGWTTSMALVMVLLLIVLVMAASSWVVPLSP